MLDVIGFDFALEDLGFREHLKCFFPFKLLPALHPIGPTHGLIIRGEVIVNKLLPCLQLVFAFRWLDKNNLIVFSLCRIELVLVRQG